MKVLPVSYLERKMFPKEKSSPIMGQLELTYRCQFDCVHCYCKGSEDKNKELTTTQWKKILDKIQRAGCFWLGFTGGDPLVRRDFLDIYSYAREKGFLVTILTNGYGLTKKILDRFAQSPPYSLEITVNGITRKTFESVTMSDGSYACVMANIRKLKAMGILVYIKSNCLTLNSHEIPKIKKWVDGFFGIVRKQRYYFSYDKDIVPRLDGNTAPCAYRVSAKRFAQIVRKDEDLRQEYEEYLHCEFPPAERAKHFLYHCSSWKNQFFINPYGRLRFCQFSNKFSVDLKTSSFKKGFYGSFPLLLNERFKTSSKCSTCLKRAFCSWCPAKAYLETGSEEAPVPYYCSHTEYILKHNRSSET
jgi:radical SAM protein with 4Fe4S-binding SPASM domain